MKISHLLRVGGLVAMLAVVVTVLAWPDLQRTASADDTGFQSPDSEDGLHDPSTWLNPDRGVSSNNAYATESDDNAEQGYDTFDLEVPTGAFILGIAVQLEAFSEDEDGCEIWVQLSWDDGSTYAPNTRVAFLTDEEQIHTVGGSNDLWGRDWAATDFDNDNFVVKLENIGTDEGSDLDCDADSTTSLDHVQVNVYYKSLTETDTEPAKEAVDGGEWQDPDEALASDNTYATENDDNDTQEFTDFNLGVPDPSLIVGIEVHLEAFSEDDDGCQILVAISGDEGDTFSAQEEVDLTDEEDTLVAGGPDYLWGESWLAENFSDANFVVEIENHEDSGCDGGSETSLDLIAAKVYYKPLADTGKSFPDATHEPNEWTDAEEALTDDDTDAVGESDGDQQGYSEFDLGVPDAAIITGISVQVDASSEDTSGCDLEVELSGNDGSSFTAPKSIDLTNEQTTYEVGDEADLWGVSWTVDSFSNENFLVVLTNEGSEGGCDADSDAHVDFLQVNVFYKEIDDEGFSPPDETHGPEDWDDAANAFVDDDTDDASSDADQDEQGYSGFGFSIDDSAPITGIEVRVQASSSDDDGCELLARLSSDDGDSYSEARVLQLTNVQDERSLGHSEDTWGRGWTGSDFDDGNFVVKLTNNDPGGACEPPEISLDYLEVNVYFKGETEQPTDTPEPSETPEDTNTPGPSSTPTITATPTVTATITPGGATQTPTPTNTPSETDTPTSTHTPTSTSTPSKPVGDVNDDGFVNAIDSLFILQYVARLITELPNADSADTSDDGMIDAVDAALILQFDADLLSQLPPP